MYIFTKGLNFVFLCLEFVLNSNLGFEFLYWKTVWILFTADIPEQGEEAPTLKSENNAASSQVIYV